MPEQALDGIPLGLGVVVKTNLLIYHVQVQSSAGQLSDHTTVYVHLYNMFIDSLSFHMRNFSCTKWVIASSQKSILMYMYTKSSVYRTVSMTEHTEEN